MHGEKVLEILNTLSPGGLEWNYRKVILKLISAIETWSISCEIALRWMWLDLIDDKSALIQVKA